MIISAFPLLADPLGPLLDALEADSRLLNDPDYIDRLDIAMTQASGAGRHAEVAAAERRLSAIEQQMMLAG